jgi:opacity protein-like surface antigen
VDSNFNAQLIGGRAVYDIDKQWSAGVQANVLRNNTGKQYAYGIEVGYVVAPNTYLTVGYNFRGFNDKDLIDSNYTNRGVVIGIRWKFDEDTFGKKDSR